AMEHLSVDAYWFWVRDARSVNDTLGTPVAEAVEFVFGLDDYEKTNFHTIGLRLYGDAGNFDYDAYLAYQFGEADQVGSLFAPIGGTYGDQNAEYDNWGMDVELGHLIDVKTQPRIFLGAAWLQGEDNRDVNLLDWLNPFDRPEASVSFNRLFSTWS
ncbi:MAG: alginate export family protein, partial [Proteobacteria bacterium]|nr:alginate export family protein [Pseudomonadota bacterium]